ncbi:MAG: Ig-like domain-containing protein [Methylobacter sp.]
MNTNNQSSQANKKKSFFRLISLSVSTAVFVVSAVLLPLSASAATVPTSFFGIHYSSAMYQPWPTGSFSILRTWDQYPGVSWIDINTSTGTYNWTNLDAVVNAAISHGTDIVYTFGITPQWASTNPNGTGCAYLNGTCYAPNISDWQAFVKAITTRYKGKIKYWELWNEPNAANFWNGTTAQMVTMAQAAYPIIKAADAGNIVLSPAPQGTNAHLWLDGYFVAGGVSYTDIVAFHGYLYGAPELIVPLIANINNIVAKYGGLSGKPVWDTEHSWGLQTWPFGANEDQQAAWLARLIPLSISGGIQRSIWYMWDGYDGQDQWGMLYNRTTNTLTKPAVAYNQVYNWLMNSNMDPCVLKGSVYQCHLTRSGNYEGLIAWASSATPTFTTSFTVPSQYVKYRTLNGATVSTSGGSTLTLTMTPILLENAPAADTTSPTASITTPTAGTTVTGTAVTVSANASDNIGVAGVQFILDGVNLGSEATALPYSILWNTTSATNGSHTLTAIARDTASNTTISSPVVVTVNNIISDTTPPTVPTGLTAKAISSSAINLAFTASTDAVGVTGYNIFRGGTQIGTSATNSYSDTGLTASTAYTYTVSAYDAAGNTSVQSASASTTTPRYKKH